MFPKIHVATIEFAKIVNWWYD